MTRRRARPEWLTRLVIDVLHHDQLREHGGLPGVRDEGALESALARPRQKWDDGGEVDVPLLAAANAFGLVKTPPYRDGNKRTGFLALAPFLELNGFELEATDADVVTEFLALASGRVTEEALADWIRRHSHR